MDPSEWALARIGLKVSIFRSMVLVVSSLQQMYLFYYHIHLLAQDIARTITEISMSTHLSHHPKTLDQSNLDLTHDSESDRVKSRIVGISMGPQPEALKFVGIENIESVPLF